MSELDGIMRTHLKFYCSIIGLVIAQIGHSDEQKIRIVIEDHHIPSGIIVSHIKEDTGEFADYYDISCKKEMHYLEVFWKDQSQKEPFTARKWIQLRPPESEVRRLIAEGVANTQTMMVVDAFQAYTSICKIEFLDPYLFIIQQDQAYKGNLIVLNFDENNKNWTILRSEIPIDFSLFGSDLSLFLTDRYLVIEDVSEYRKDKEHDRQEIPLSELNMRK